MGSHRDDDYLPPGYIPDPRTREVEQRLSELTRRAEALTKAGLNRITAGEPGEEPLSEKDTGGVLVRRLPDDPLCLRVSMGEALPQLLGSYCTFRGDPAECIALMERCLQALRAMKT